MKNLILTAALALAASPVLASEPQIVPEMDVGAGVAAIALLAGVVAIVREKMKK